ncbi:hypothetical protein QJQ45_000394 [Haematococcus lacustris]|nr:hypothetical protein QJQ45_000394 [Haematococcus lacustris]
MVLTSGAWLGIGIAIGAAAGVVIGITVGLMLGRMRSVSRDTSGVRTAAETPRDLAASTNYDPIGLGPLQTAAARIKTTGIQQTPSDTQMSKSDNWKAHGPSLDQNTLDAHVPATGTRGVEYALGAAVAEIVKFRSWNVAAHRPAH